MATAAVRTDTLVAAAWAAQEQWAFYAAVDRSQWLAGHLETVLCDDQLRFPQLRLKTKKAGQLR